MSFESILIVPRDALTAARVDVGRVVEKIAERAFPSVTTEGGASVTIYIRWEADDLWELREKVDEVKVEVDALLNRGLTWDRPDEIEEER